LAFLTLTSYNGVYQGPEWVEFYSDENTIHKCRREDYLEMKELMSGSEDEKYSKQYYNLLYNESLYYTENYYEIKDMLKTKPLYNIPEI
jgi:hypothetical protein